ncbi:intein-containing dynein axonemal heavy chain 10 precursor [Anaeramoeba ignava]|uniref:Intein-containing dynein axonemal heavy chain 10 n=1 Tax=Anaeramoeba ignava TaxID=1746090 RepID=A0A9Q0L893_ANAIG|nr:intein-containing dynein axonemal heavy chain 10 precursor [Anaeramoeba ignava]
MDQEKNTELSFIDWMKNLVFVHFSKDSNSFDDHDQKELEEAIQKIANQPKAIIFSLPKKKSKKKENIRVDVIEDSKSTPQSSLIEEITTNNDSIYFINQENRDQKQEFSFATLNSANSLKIFNSTLQNVYYPLFQNQKSGIMIKQFSKALSAAIHRMETFQKIHIKMPHTSLNSQTKTQSNPPNQHLFTKSNSRAKPSFNWKQNGSIFDSINSSGTNRDQHQMQKPSEKITQNNYQKIIRKWIKSITSVIQIEKDSQKYGKGAMSEIHYWRDRYSIFSSMVSQFQQNETTIKTILSGERDTALVRKFHQYFTELSNLANQARENTKFLDSLENHIDIIVSSHSLREIAENMPNLFDSLRLIWILSKFYNTDQLMFELLQLIILDIEQAIQFKVTAEKVFGREEHQMKSFVQEKDIDERDLCGISNTHPDHKAEINNNPDSFDIEEEIDQAKQITMKVKKGYLETRAKIEKTKGANRWEFDRTILFNHLDYINQVCDDLIEMKQKLATIDKFLIVIEKLGSKEDLETKRSIFHDREKIFHLAQEIDFEPFGNDKEEKSKWIIFKKTFNKMSQNTQSKTNLLLEKTFHTLNSSQSCYELLKMFEITESEKFSLVLDMLSAEIDAVDHQFENEKSTKTKWKTSQILEWSLDLFLKIKSPMLTFRSSSYFNFKSQKGALIIKKYSQVGRKILSFNKQVIAQFNENINSTLVPSARNAVLKRDGLFLRVNIAPSLFEMITQIHQINNLGFQQKIPQFANEIALQMPRFESLSSQLECLVNNYNQIIPKIHSRESHIMHPHIQNVLNLLKPCFSVINLTTLSLNEFIEKGQKSVNELKGLVEKVDSWTQKIDTTLAQIRESILLSFPDQVMEFEHFFQFLSSRKKQKVEEMIQKYSQIPKYIEQIEQIIFGTKTNSSPKLKKYYSLIETEIQKAITHMLENNLKLLFSKFQNKKEMIEIQAFMDSSGISFSPKMKELEEKIGQTIQEIVDSSKFFIRWISGTCIKEIPKKIPGRDKLSVPSFRDEVLKNGNLMQLMKEIDQYTQERTQFLAQKIQQDWDTFILILFVDPIEQIQQFQSKKLTLNHFELKFEEWINIISQIEEMESTSSKEKNLENQFIAVNIKSLVSIARYEARKWKNERYGNILIQNVKQHLIKLDSKIDSLLQDLLHTKNQKIRDLPDLKKILNLISQIRECAVSMNEEIQEISQQIQILEKFDIEPKQNEKEEQKANLPEILVSVQEKKENLQMTASETEKGLEQTKAHFAEKTKKQRKTISQEIDAFAKDFENQNLLTNNSISINDSFSIYQKFLKLFEENLQKVQKTDEEYKLFHLEIDSIESLTIIEKQLNILKPLFELWKQQKEQIQSWCDTLWQDLALEEMNQIIGDFETKIRKLDKIPQYKKSALLTGIEKEILEFKHNMPLIQDLKNPSLQPRHWQQLQSSTNTNFALGSKNFTLGSVLQMELTRFADIIGQITIRAMKEDVIEKEIFSIEEKWTHSMNFEVRKYSRGNEERGLVLSSVDEIITLVDEQNLNVQSMSSSPFAEPFTDSIRLWEKRLSLISEVIEVWISMQKKWIYLENIFNSEDIVAQLPQEAKKFSGADKHFSKIMSQTAQNPNVLEACLQEGRLEFLKSLLNQLESCQKSLKNYLDYKRALFPRFYFISDDDLLSILGTSDQTSIQEHIIKLFDNTLSLKFRKIGSFSENQESSYIVDGMISPEGEHLNFHDSVPVEGNVETWMTNVEAEMRKSLRLLTKEALFYYPKIPRIEWIRKYPGMVSLVGSQIFWTFQVEYAFEMMKQGELHSMKKLLERLSDQISDLTQVIQTDLTKQDRKKLNTMIIIDVHAREVVSKLVRDSVPDETQFEWQSQLRFYWDREEDTVVVRQGTGKFEYGYEYMGLNGRLVITPLTDRMNLTVTQALSLNLGSAPAGPAGTGKTESVRDLSKALALKCVVINCGEGMDYRVMSSFFAGLVQCGAWGCFDEFNRLEPATLSVVSSQLKTIQNALQIGTQKFSFENREITLDPKCGFHITMNPGYLGRSELPDSLKALFRPVVMTVPDTSLICEIMLFSEGFSQAKILAKKMALIYKLAKIQLSKQLHYDFGLRAVKSVLVRAGSLKRKSEEKEEDVLMKAILDSNKPKMVEFDLPLFKGLVQDMFPDVAINDPQLNGDLVSAIKQALEMEALQEIPHQIGKMIQLYETMQTRHTVMLVGGTRSGKCLGKNTPILMSNNTAKFVDKIKQGEFVMGDDFQPRKVLKTTRGFGKMFEIEQYLGISYQINEFHILSLFNIEEMRVVDISIRSYLRKSPQWKRKHYGFRRFRIEYLKLETIYEEPFLLGFIIGSAFSKCEQQKEKHKIVKLGCEKMAQFDKINLDRDDQARKNLLTFLAGIIYSFMGISFSKKEDHFDLSFPIRTEEELIFFQMFRKMICCFAKEKKMEFWRVNQQEGVVLIQFANSNIWDEIDLIEKSPKNHFGIFFSGETFLIYYPLKIYAKAKNEFYGFQLEPKNKEERFLLSDGTVTHNSTIIQTLSKAMTILGNKTKIYALNPKAIDLSELYGKLDTVTRNWNDGIFSSIFREINKPLGEDANEFRRILLDGDLDARYVEDMNSLMDDNKLLVLPNGERIRLQPHCSLLFEVSDLRFASPATISRCGMIYVDSSSVTPLSLFMKWSKQRFSAKESMQADFGMREEIPVISVELQKSNDEVQSLCKEREHLFHMLYQKYLPECFAVCEDLPKIIPQTKNNMIFQLTTILDSFLSKNTQNGKLVLDDPWTVESIFIFAIIWSIGSSLVADSRKELDEVIKKIYLRNENESFGTFPKEHTLFDCFFDEIQGKWRLWEELSHPYDPSIDGMLVSTSDTVRYGFLLDLFVKISKPVLFIGHTGTAKTVIIENYLRSLARESHTILKLNLTNTTTSRFIQNTILDHIEKRTRGVYGPTLGKKLIIFIDDLNMPQPDEYETQQTTAFLKHLIEYNGFYGRDKDLSWIEIRDVQIIAAMRPGKVDPRFISLFNVMHIPSPQPHIIKMIFDSLLNSHLSLFNSEIQNAISSRLTDMTLDLFKQITLSLRPSQTKFHYSFSLRDISRVYDGLVVLSTSQKFKSITSFLRLWRNEVLLNFSSRLILEEDRILVDQKLEGTLRKYFADFLNGTEIEDIVRNPILFGDFGEIARKAKQKAEVVPDQPFQDNEKENFIDQTQEEEEERRRRHELLRIYEDLGDYENVRFFIDQKLEEYNEKYPDEPMDLVLFDNFICEVVRIHRILRQRYGNALMIGNDGIGKKSISKLAAFIAGYELFQIKLTRTFGKADFLDALKKLYLKTGVEKKKVVFLFTSAELVHESFMEEINSMLTSFVGTLYSEEEKEPIINSLKEEVSETGVFASREDCWNYFITKCRENLRLCLCFPPGEQLRQLFPKYPGLLNNTIIDWMSETWPEDALRLVGQKLLSENLVMQNFVSEFAQNGKGKGLIKGLIEVFVETHQNAIQNTVIFEHKYRRKIFVTPKIYLDFLKEYLILLKEKITENQKTLERIEGGLEKLTEAEEGVKQLRKNLAVQKKVVEEKTQASEDLLDQIAARKSEVEKKKKVSSEKEREVAEKFEQISQEKREAEAVLEKALPVLEKARSALSNLNRGDLVEIRAFANPPELVRSVCECVVILRGFSDVSWSGAKAMMASTSFLRELIEFDLDTLTQQKINAVQEYMKHPKFNVVSMKKISSAGTGLISWVLAVVNYYSTALEVAPKREKVATAQASLEISQKELDKIQKEVESLSQMLRQFEMEYEKATQELELLKKQAQLMQERLFRASQLITGLGAEKLRWTAQSQSLKKRKTRLVGDCLLCASFLGYCGPLNAEFRAKVLEEVKHKLTKEEIPLTSTLQVQELLTTDAEINKWQSEGLPIDQTTVENGILASFGRGMRFPLLIDPQNQLVRWIKQRHTKNLDVSTFDTNNFLQQLVLAIQYGKHFVFEGADSGFDPVVDPILFKNLKSTGGRKTVNVADKEVDWDDDFMLYLSTKQQNPELSPEIFGKSRVVNCKVTEYGLESQLLNVVVGIERADLEKSRTELIDSMNQSHLMLQQLEDQLLHQLASSQGNILDDAPLIEMLETTKTKASEINTKLKESEITAAEIDRARKSYAVVAKRGSSIFFTMASMAELNSMYEVSMSSFLSLFESSVTQSQPANNLDSRLQNIIDELMVRAYNSMCLGLFERHKLLFSFQLALNIHGYSQPELDFLLRGNTSLQDEQRGENPEWISQKNWRDLQQLSSLSDRSENMFQSLLSQIKAEEEKWKLWVFSSKPEAIVPPCGDVSGFQMLMLLRCLRSDRLVSSLSSYVSSHLGERFIHPPTLNYADIFHEFSTQTTPIIFVLSPGADPTEDIFKLAEGLGYSARLKFLSLGQGQEPVAQKMLETAVRRGQWVLLQNCHLMPSFLKNLEIFIEKINAVASPSQSESKFSVHEDFRLFLTTEPTSLFPVSVLQHSFKVVLEPPNAIQLNLHTIYNKISDVQLVHCKHPQFKSLVFVLAFLHSVLLERKKLGKCAWNVQYDFNDSDFRVSMQILDTYLTRAQQNKEQIPWESLRYLLGQAIYGGRVTDELDRRVLSTYFSEYFGKFIFEKTGEPFSLYTNKEENISIQIPAVGTRKDYLDWISRLRLDDSPQVLGLHPNSQISHLTSLADGILRGLVDLQPRVSLGRGGSRESLILGIVEEIETKWLPQEPFDLKFIEKGWKKDETYSPSPTQIALFQELEEFNHLIKNIRSVLKDLSKAEQGEAIMTTKLQSLETSLFVGEVPSAFLDSQTDKNLSSWLVHLRKRYTQFLDWVKNGQPLVVWLPGLKFPDTFLNAVLQIASRENKWPLDQTIMFTVPTHFLSPQNVSSSPSIGCYIHGLNLEGAGFDFSSLSLVHQLPHQLSISLPVFHVIPCLKKQSQIWKQGTFLAPVYSTKNRNNSMGVGYLFDAYFKSKTHESFWILNSVSVILD